MKNELPQVGFEPTTLCTPVHVQCILYIHVHVCTVCTCACMLCMYMYMYSSPQ